MADQMLLNIVKLALEDEIDVDECKLQFTALDHQKGNTGKITSVVVTKDTLNFAKNLIIKWHQNQQVSPIPVREIFNQEMFVYTTVQMAFKKLALDLGLHEFALLPHCYTALSTPTYQALVFDNLECQKFKLHDERKALDLHHTKLVLEGYARWHGLSFALKVLRPGDFKSITKDFINMFPMVLKRANRIKGRQKDFAAAKHQIRESVDADVLKYLKFTDAEIEYALTEMHLEDSKYHVITHGDCWINNFMFFCEDDTRKPSAVRIIDWQCSGLTSPVFDLSHFIYSCTNTLAMENVFELLEIYHRNMKNFFKFFGLDIEEIFPFGVLKEHWKRFSHYGLLLSSRILKDCHSGGKLGPDGDFLLSEENLKNFSERVCNNFVHYAFNQKCRLPQT